MNYNTEEKIMSNKNIESNARMALSQYKLEIGSELNDTSTNSIPYVGGLATKKLVEMAEKQLVDKYNK